MKVIGRGWQYSVYYTGKGRVFKKYNSRFLTYLILLRDCFPYLEHPLWKFPAYYERCRMEAVYSMQEILHTTIQSWMLGNPRVVGTLDYEQDFVVSLRKKLEQGGREEGERIVDSFVEFNKVLIEHSLIDRNFLITDNFGMNADGNIILMDLGELCTDAKTIRHHLAKRPWATFDVVNSLPANLRDYFVNEMDKAFYKKSDTIETIL